MIVIARSPVLLVLLMAATGCHGEKALPPSFLSPESEKLFASPTSRDLPPPPDPGLKIRTAWFTLEAPDAVRGDGVSLARALEGSIRRLAADYLTADADALLRKATVTVHVAATPSDRCGPGQATTISSWNEGVCTAEIHVLAPSAHPDPDAPHAPRTLTGEPMDFDYAHRVLVHEYATILLESITRRKRGGWSFWSAPAWFVQGSEEFLGLSYSNDRARQKTLRAYTLMTHHDALVTNDWGFEAQSPYVSGSVIVAFLHDRFGRDAFIALLESQEQTFGRAVRRALGTGPDEFFALWSAWLQDNAGESRAE